MVDRERKHSCPVRVFGSTLLVALGKTAARVGVVENGDYLRKGLQGIWFLPAKRF